MDFPKDFRCPISMELMKDPVIISTGVTYDRKSIEKWFYIYKKRICPATMQCIDNLEVTPNHTLKRLIIAWLDLDGAGRTSSSMRPQPSAQHDELLTLLGTIELTPFKVNSLRKLQLIIETGDNIIKEEFKSSRGVEVLVKIIINILSESSDFIAFRACEEAISVLHHVPFSDEDEKILQLLRNTDSINSMVFMLQNGSAEARFHIISIFQKIAKADNNQFNSIAENQGIDFFKSLLEIMSDEAYTKASSCALQLLLEIFEISKKSRLKSIEAGGICTLIELLPDSNRSKCEKIMMLIKCLCECPEGRLSFIDHELGIAVVAKKMLNVSYGVTKLGVKILWLISSFYGSDRVLEEMLVCGAVKKLVALLHIGGGGSETKGRVVKMLTMHGRTWQRYPCFSSDWKVYLGLGND